MKYTVKEIDGSRSKKIVERSATESVVRESERDGGLLDVQQEGYWQHIHIAIVDKTRQPPQKGKDYHLSSFFVRSFVDRWNWN